jgi:hypothetical protein
VLGEAALMLDGEFYEADVQSVDRIVLTNEEDLVTLDRVSGSPPVTPWSASYRSKNSASSDGVGSCAESKCTVQRIVEGHCIGEPNLAQHEVAK